MRRLATLSILLLLITFSLFSEDDNDVIDLLSELNGSPSGIVNGSVDVISGKYSEMSIDIHMRGASGLTFERSSSGSAFRWMEYQSYWFSYKEHD